jgi:hypothetical protein
LRWRRRSEDGQETERPIRRSDGLCVAPHKGFADDTTRPGDGPTSTVVLDRMVRWPQLIPIPVRLPCPSLSRLNYGIGITGFIFEDSSDHHYHCTTQTRRFSRGAIAEIDMTEAIFSTEIRQLEAGNAGILAAIV